MEGLCGAPYFLQVNDNSLLPPLCKVLPARIFLLKDRRKVSPFFDPWSITSYTEDTLTIIDPKLPIPKISSTINCFIKTFRVVRGWN